ncbi:MAG: hypothetical protein U1F35_01100 [Steroidobacteraceae bacterium]
MRTIWVLPAAAALLLAGLARAEPPSPAPHGDAASRGGTQPATALPDEALLEFLGQDDVEDAKWWEWFRQHRGAAREAGDDPPAAEDTRS